MSRFSMELGSQKLSNQEMLDDAEIEALMAEIEESDQGSQEIIENQENPKKLIMSENLLPNSIHDPEPQKPQEQSLRNKEKIVGFQDQKNKESEVKRDDDRINEITDDDLKMFFQSVSLGQIPLSDHNISDIIDSRIMENNEVQNEDLPNNVKIDFGGQELAEEIKYGSYGDDLNDFFEKVETDKQLYDEYGNLLTKPKSIFTALDRFYTRPLSYLKLDIVNSAEYTRKSRALDSALTFLNSKKCKELLVEVEPPESLGLLTINVKDSAIRYNIVPPKSRKEYKESRHTRPWFMWSLTFIQAVLVIVSFVMNYNNTGGVIQTVPFNPMIGPNPGILITLGARYIPCMKETPGNWTNIICPAGVLVKPASNATCSLKDICRSDTKDQAWRFITPMFLHSGILHFVLNAAFQMRVASTFEREIGSWKLAAIFFVSGVGGYIFGASFSTSAASTPSVGSSGGLFGIIACLTLDLFMNWSLLKSPKLECFKTLLNISIAFIMGWLPGVDNFSHIGGYFFGLFMGFLLMPKIYFSKKDRIRKTIIQYLSLPIVFALMYICVLGFTAKQPLQCPSCQYLNCVPGLPWYPLIVFLIKIGVIRKGYRIEFI